MYRRACRNRSAIDYITIANIIVSPASAVPPTRPTKQSFTLVVDLQLWNVNHIQSDEWYGDAYYLRLSIICW